MSSDTFAVLMAFGIATFTALLTTVVVVGVVQSECESFAATTLNGQKYICTKVEK